MGELVTLEHARTHLKVVIHDDDADIQRKAAQASQIVIDYLAEDANIPIAIDDSAAASPVAIITTEEAHGFATGDTVVITDHEDSDPDLNGSHEITVLSTTTFSVPVALTTAGTGGLATGQWTPATVPLHVQAAVLFMLTQLHENRDTKMDDEVWAAIQRVLVRSRIAGFA